MFSFLLSLHAGRVGSLDTRRRHIGVASVHGSLYAVGGSDGASYLKSAERFDPKMNQVRCAVIYWFVPQCNLY